MQLERQFLSYLVTRINSKVAVIAKEHVSPNIDSATKELQSDINELQKTLDVMFEQRSRRSRNA